MHLNIMQFHKEKNLKMNETFFWALCLESQSIFAFTDNEQTSVRKE